jgi:hypothetical protein
MDYNDMTPEQKLKCFALAIQLVGSIDKSIFKAQTTYEGYIDKLNEIAMMIGRKVS